MQIKAICLNWVLIFSLATSDIGYSFGSNESSGPHKWLDNLVSFCITSLVAGITYGIVSQATVDIEGRDPLGLESNITRRFSSFRHHCQFQRYSKPTQFLLYPAYSGYKIGLDLYPHIKQFIEQT